MNSPLSFRSAAATVAVTLTALTQVVYSQAPAAQGGQARAAAAQQAPSGVQRFEARTGGSTHISFRSDAPLETLDGVTSVATGNFTVNLDHPNQQATGRIETTVASLRTGNDMRDEHLRGDSWLDGAHHPNIVFEITGTDIRGPIRPGRPVRGRVRGRFTLHGVTKDIVAPVTVRLVPLTSNESDQIGINADMLRVQAEFKILLTDYGISVPSVVRLKVSNEIQIRVDLTTFRTQG
ncbi:MAG: YceI family protein [Polyangiales bacterium]